MIEVSQDSPSPGQDLSPGTQEYEVMALSTRLCPEHKGQKGNAYGTLEQKEQSE
jgi:hypothetical protein